MDDLVLTIDVDWAPIEIVEPMVAQLVKHRVKTTWFVTDGGATLDLLRAHSEIFELGVHPNFLPGSTQGSEPSEILDHVLDLVPEAVSLRTHASVFSGRLVELFFSRERLQIDATAFLPSLRGTHPIRHWYRGRSIWRVPYVWADDHAMEMPNPHWTLDTVLEIPGLKVISFHPIHIFLNTAHAADHIAFKQRGIDIRKGVPENIPAGDPERPGAANLFHQVVRHLGAEGASRTLKDLFK